MPGSTDSNKPLPDAQVRLIVKALADPRRYEILKRLGNDEKALACEKMRECIGITPATLSHHMKELEVAGLVEVVRHGKFASYVLRRDVVDAFLDRVRADLI